MKIFYYAIIFLIFLNSLSFSKDIKEINELIKHSNKLINEQKYSESLPILNELCNKFNVESGCFTLAHYTEQLADDNKKLKSAMDIYRRLINSKDNDISKESNEALNRIQLYNFIESFFNIRSDIINERINYDDFDLELNRLNPYILPEKTRDIYLKLKQVLLKMYKLDEEHTFFNSVIKPMGNVATGDFIGAFSGMPKLYKDAFTRKNLQEDANKLFQQFINSLDYGISTYWLNSRIRLYNNSIKGK